jgi:hypothetical protein
VARSGEQGETPEAISVEGHEPNKARNPAAPSGRSTYARLGGRESNCSIPVPRQRGRGSEPRAGEEAGGPDVPTRRPPTPPPSFTRERNLRGLRRVTLCGSKTSIGNHGEIT